MKQGSRDLIIKHLCRLSVFFANTINPRTIISGFRTIGLFPWHGKKLLERCDGWDDYTCAQQTQMVEAIPSLARLMAGSGVITDKMMEQLLPFLLPTPAERNSKDNDDRITCQRRALLFLDENYDKWKAEDNKKKERQQREAASNKEQKATEAAAKKRKAKENKEKAEERKNTYEKSEKRQKTEAAEHKRKEKEDKRWNQVVLQAHRRSMSTKKNSKVDDWTCFMCQSRWTVWQEFEGLKDTASSSPSRTQWLQGNKCDHSFCPACATEATVDKHSKSCSKGKRGRGR